MPASPAPIAVADSITRIAEAEARGAVVVNASHGDIYAAYLAAKLGAAAAIFNDAGIGRDRAGISGLVYLQDLGMPAATVGHDTARIGDGADMLARGVVTHANALAEALGGSAAASRPAAGARSRVPADFRPAAGVGARLGFGRCARAPRRHRADRLAWRLARRPAGNRAQIRCTRCFLQRRRDWHRGSRRVAPAGARRPRHRRRDRFGRDRPHRRCPLDLRGWRAVARQPPWCGAWPRARHAGARGGRPAPPRLRQGDEPMTTAAKTAGRNRPEGRMNGGRALAEMLRLSGAGPMFGMGGFQLLPFYDALSRLGMRHSLINDERCGAFAADAYARVTNRPGICDGTLGPGATNLVTGLIESLNGGIPVVAIAGDTNRLHSWKNMTQECRQAEILRPAVKELIRVEHTSRIPELTRRAFAVATSGRPGPVLLDVPEDVCHGSHDFDAADFWFDPGTLSAQARRTRPDPHELARAAALIAKAERPLLLVGG